MNLQTNPSSLSFAPQSHPVAVPSIIVSENLVRATTLGADDGLAEELGTAAVKPSVTVELEETAKTLATAVGAPQPFAGGRTQGGTEEARGVPLQTASFASDFLTPTRRTSTITP